MPLVPKTNTVTSGYQAVSNVQVSVCCEQCGNTYTYQYQLTGYSSNNQTAAQANLADKVERVSAGDYGLIADERPCPQCGYLQSWMIEPVRRKRGWMIGAGIAMAACLLAILIEALLLPENIRNDAVQGIFMVFGLPVITFFVARAVIMKTYRPTRQIAPRTNTPKVSF